MNCLIVPIAASHMSKFSSNDKKIPLSKAMNLYLQVAALSALTALTLPDVAAEGIADAHYGSPVDRYGHFALGRPHEYAILTVATDKGRSFSLQLPENEVFEDVKPRIIKLAKGDPDEILTIVSSQEIGSRIVLIRLNGEHLEISAQSLAIGSPMRWLNLVGVADLDGDGRAEIAAVTTPHMGGFLRVYRRQGGELVEIASLMGFSNHVYGSPEQGLSTPVQIVGQMQLLVPDASRHQLRIIALQGGQLIETGRCGLAGQVTGRLKIVSSAEILVGLSSGPQLVVLSGCRP